VQPVRVALLVCRARFIDPLQQSAIDRGQAGHSLGSGPG
jgi:hypothetical protein